MNDDQVQGTTLDERLAKATSTETAGETENNPQEPMPSSEQKQTEEVTEEQVSKDQGTQDDLTLPEGVTERTRQQFEKLKARLAEAEAKANPSQASDYGSSVFDSFRQQQGVDSSTYGNLNQQQVDSITSRFVDEEGNVDINGLNQELTRANDRAAKAEDRAARVEDRLERIEESQQVREAHAVHPWLDPKNPEFDPLRFELVRDRILRVKYYEGQPISLLEAADYISKGTSATPVNLDKVSEEAVTKYKESQEKRQQGPIESGRGETRQTSDLQDLREKTRRENPNLENTPALDERLRAIGVFKGNPSE